ncbi:MAG TPA: isocitrate lyase/phosphoenolpyruvate mutase family protein, partial [Bacillota bacterium]
GYGNAINVRRTVREFERAGVAAIHLEDQEWPKRCGHFEGKRLISREEMVQKVRAAVDARLDDDFVIIARTDAIAVEGFEAALERAAAYAEAGADMLFVEAPRTLEQIRVIAEQLPVPLLFNMGDSGKTPNVSAAELERWGYRVMIIPGTHRIVIPAVRRYLEHLRETGDIGQNPCERMPWDEWQAFVGLPEIEALERRYAG